jgi:hypothetical protein
VDEYLSADGFTLLMNAGFAKAEWIKSFWCRSQGKRGYPGQTLS